MDGGKPQGREALTDLMVKVGEIIMTAWPSPAGITLCLSPSPTGTFWGSECGPGLVGHWGLCADPSPRAP